MKGHVSIFMFLLGAIAATGPLVPLDVRAATVTRPCIITDQPLDITIQTGISSEPTWVRRTSDKSLSSDYYYLLYDGAWTSVTAPQRIGKKLDGWYTLSADSDPSDITLAKLSVQLKTTDSFAKNDLTAAKTTNWSGQYGVIGPKYSYKELKIEFDGNGATSGSTAAQGGLNYDSQDIVLNLSGFVRTGYTFADWTNRVGMTFSDGATVQGSDFWVGGDDGSFDSKLYANWTENTYTLGSSGENCTVTVGSSAKYTDAVTVSWTPASETGKAFTFGSAAVYSGSTKIGDLSSASPATFRMSDLNAYYGAVTVKVVYTSAPTQHTLTVSSADSQKGSVGKEPNASKYDYGSSVTIRATANDGYAFEKWSDGSTQAERQLKVTDDAAYTASFTNRQYVITFHANGGESDPDPMVVTYGSYIGTLPTAKQFKKTFRGWYTEPAGGSQVTRLDVYRWTIDIELFAQWDPAEEVIVTAAVLPSAEAGTVTITPEQYEKGDSVAVAAKASEGYSFKDWSDGNTAPVTNFTVVGNLKLTAVFTGNVYKVTFMLVDYEGNVPDPMMVTYGSPFGPLPEPTLDDPDYQFDYWMDEDDVPVTEETIVRMSSLYAHISRRPAYQVAYVGGADATGEMPSQKFYCGVATNLAANAFAKAGYIFTGWATNETEAAESKVSFADGARIESDLTADGGSITLYAVWRELTLSEAMHCTNLVWTSDGTIGTEAWKVMAGGGCGFEGSGSCVSHAGAADVGNRQYLTTTFTASGHLSFRWKGTYIGVKVGTAVIQYYQSVRTWNAFEVDIEGCEEVPVKIEIRNYGIVGESAEIDQMTWTPKGEEPGYDENDTTVDAFSMADGKLSFSFNGDGRTYHLLGTNDLVAPMPWPMVFETNQASGTISFGIPVKEDEPKMFYRIRALK